MRIGLTSCLIAIAIWALPIDAFAYKLNPCLRILVGTGTGLSQRPINEWNPCPLGPQRLQPAVHEHMTFASIREYRGVPVGRGTASKSELWAENYMRLPSWSVRQGKPHETYALIFGTWWNDDPLMYLWGERADFRSGLTHLNEMFSERPRAAYEGGVNDCPVATDQHLGRASHFGALQHLHFMSNLGNQVPARDRIAETTREALSWIEFAYAVAIGEIPAYAPLTVETEQLLKLPSLAKNLCLRDARNVKVRSLFTRQGPADARNLKFRNRITPDVALGSILHVLQDSFSPAHTCRVEMEGSNGSMAVLGDIYNYNLQDHNDHALKDDYPIWLIDFARTGKHRYINDPVVIGAWLLAAVDSKLPWKEVRVHLESTIFAVDPGVKMAGARKCI